MNEKWKSQQQPYSHQVYLYIQSVLPKVSNLAPLAALFITCQQPILNSESTKFFHDFVKLIAASAFQLVEKINKNKFVKKLVHRFKIRDWLMTF